jgi:signal transduction histidine kinase
VSTAPNSDDDLLLPRPPGIVRRFWMRHTLLADVLIALFGLLAGYVQNIDSGAGIVEANWMVDGWFPFVLIGAAALILRRSRPLLTLGIVTVCSGVLTLAVGGSLLAPIVLAVYAVAVYCGNLAAVIGSVVAFAVFAVTAIVSSRQAFGHSELLVALVVVLLIGSNLGNRRRYLNALIDRAAQLARERDAQGQLATAAERARIAREMHDVVAHSLSVMVRLSDGADAVADSDPARSREAVRQIGEVGRESLRDMRRLLGVLREGENEGTAELGPQPTLGDLDRLVETYRVAGLPVAVQAIGTPPTDSAVQVAVYRAVQESLTNALRYSREPNRVLVQLDYTDGVVVEVTDDGLNLGPAPSVGTGRGLVGLRERATVFGGSVEAGPRIDPLTGQDGGGWRVRLRLPRPREDHR